MDKPKKPGTAWDPRRVPLHRRIRNRREELGLTAVQLAHSVDVSPSYISLIEKGAKVPSEEVAARIALALRDDPGLYVAWTHSTRHEDPERQIRDLTRLHTLSSDPAMLERLASGEDMEEDELRQEEEELEEPSLHPIERRHLIRLCQSTPSKPHLRSVVKESSFPFRKLDPVIGHPPDEEVEENADDAEPEADDAWDMMTLGSPEMRSALHEVDDAVRREQRLVGDADELAYPDMIEIPVLEDGADPGDDPTASGHLIDLIHFDPRALPLETAGSLFAYRPGRAFLRRVEGLIKPGDLVILSSRMGRLAPDRIHALRREGEILLSRVLYKRNALLLLPSEDSARIEVIDVPGREALPGIIAGSVVTTLRNWRRRKGETTQRGTTLLRLEKLAKRAAWLRDPRSIVAASEVGLLSTRPTPRGRPRWRTAELQGRHLVRDCEWKPRYGWRPVQRAIDLDFLEQNPQIKVRFRLIRGGELRFHLEMDADEWREALGDYADGPTWRRNGYIVPVTKMRKGEYTEEFKDRWAPYVTRKQ